MNELTINLDSRSKKPLYEIEDAAQRENVKVQF